VISHSAAKQLAAKECSQGREKSGISPKKGKKKHCSATHPYNEIQLYKNYYAVNMG
jgi:hypothetical protein